MGAPTRIRFTYHDYKSIPETDPRRFELLDGELVMAPVPSVWHQNIAGNLYAYLRQVVRKHNLGRVFFAPIDVVLSETDVVQPDLLFVARGHEDRIREEGIFGAPDLVVEILSPATESRDRGYKRTLYARHGVREYWIVDPQARRVEVYTLTSQGLTLWQTFGPGQTLRSALLPEFTLPVDEVFSQT